MTIITLAFMVSIGINLLMFVPAFLFKTDKLTDISYLVTFVCVAVFGYFQSVQNNFHKLILLLVLLWAVRLGSFLFMHINKVGKDVRFDGIRENLVPFLKFWLLQGVTVFIVMLSPLVGYLQKSSRISVLSWMGTVIFLSGLIIEAVADAQKFHFNSSSQNKGNWIDAGIWRASRHPNYLGEIMVWVGMYVVVVSSLSTSELLIGLASPVFIICLLCFVSGIPLLEKSADKKWGDKKEFRQYRAEVPLLIPSPASIKRSL